MKAVDGNTDGDFRDGSVTLTATGDPDPWWNADFGKLETVRVASIWNRTDCCEDRLSEFMVISSETHANACQDPNPKYISRYAGYAGLNPLDVQIYPVGKLDKLRSVCIKRTNPERYNEPLSFAEVEFGMITPTR